MSTVSFNLRVLFDQHQRGLNKWSFPNDQLDLARYRGCKFTFYRTKDCDFIGQYDIVAPYALDKDSCPSYHPGMMIQAKNKFLVPSYDTRPRGRQKVTVKIQPPRLFEDKWYTQEDLCEVNLVSLAVSAASFTHPFGSPQTDNLCVTFQVLDPLLNSVIGFSSKQHQVVLNHLYTHNTYWSSHLTPYFTTNLKKPYPQSNGQPQTAPNADKTLQIQDIKIAGDTNYNWYPYNMTNQSHTLGEIRQQYFKWETSLAPQGTTSNLGKPNEHPTPTNDYYEYHLGLFSPIFIGPTRTSNIFPAAYFDCVYNPLTDKGVGNHVWFQYNSKADTQIASSGLYCHIQDKPLWAALYGYSEFAAKTTGDGAITANTRLCVRCPYTDPMLIDRNNDLQGFVPYSKNFGKGKMPGGSSNVPLSMRVKWYVMLFHQLEWIEVIVESGPFAYKGDEKSAVLAMKYTSRWKWGGNPVSHQVVRNPCKKGTQASRVPRGLQATDPKRVAPPLVFHSWDYRRGYFGHASIKRMSEESEPPTLFTGPSGKRPRRDTNVQQAEEEQQKESSSFRLQRQLQPWINSSQETQSSQEEIQAQGSIQDQLLQQLGEQRALRKQLELLAGQVLKVQAGHHLHPLLSSQA